jgi:DNA-binding transcriptional regulator YiaG
MTTIALRAVLGSDYVAPDATNSGWWRTPEGGWDATNTGVVTLGRAAAEVGTVLRSMAAGMMEAVDPGWLTAAARYYEILIDDVPGTGAATILRHELRHARVSNVSFLAPDQVIAEIRATLGLNIAETARALGVERPTVYAWLAGQAKPQRANLLRLGRVADIAASWRRRTYRPLGDLVRVPGADGRSIAEMLADGTLRDRDVDERLDAAARHLLAPGAKLRRQGVADVHEAAARHGLSTGPREGIAAEIDWLTRPSFDD